MKNAIQICGTGSGVGKSIITAGLCRIFLKDGYHVCPFKAQNMALNSFVTENGGEIGRSQANQAFACSLKPHVDMNPILLKPNSDTGSQVILLGKPIGNITAVDYEKLKKTLRKQVKKSFDRLKEQYELIVIEGAGSPSEINLKAGDIVNMKMAEYADAPVILVGDIDKGGVFAWIIGTLSLLTKKEKQRVKGIIINKFRGDKKLLQSGIDFLEKKTGIKVLGIVPYFKDIKIPEEDSVYFENYKEQNKYQNTNKTINIEIVLLPHISNFTDFDPLFSEKDVNVRYVKTSQDINKPDILILPGTKNTISDFKFIKESGIADKIYSLYKTKGTIIIGICGGFQMLGKKIYDKYFIESKEKEIQCLSLLPLETNLEKTKSLFQVQAKSFSGSNIVGYEIHHGKTIYHQNLKHFSDIFEKNGRKNKHIDGAILKNIYGTYIHGIFDSNEFRKDFLNMVRKNKNLSPVKNVSFFNLNNEFDKLEKILRENIDMDYLYKILKS
ncbi:MAG: cobyric acid synthase [Candidatus Omnitrophica bacterium]|jgi:adenosylcobyric acid synthase|nr:cobyric acid synthase [Candidatus Omnitrophota bacterium]